MAQQFEGGYGGSQYKRTTLKEKAKPSERFYEKESTPKISAPSVPKVSAPKVSAPSPVSAPKSSSNEQSIRDKYTAQINNEIARYEKQMQDELARLRQQGEAAIGRNNDYLEQQLTRLNEQKAVGDQQTIDLQNRRGGFYSGGTDYFLAQNQRATQQARGDLQGEIGSRNAEIENSNNLAAQQVMSKVQMLREQAPDRIRELVDAALERQWARDMQEKQFAFQQEQARAQAARAAASRALEQQRLAQQQAQQQWENQMAEDRFSWEKNQSQLGSQSTAPSSLSQRDKEALAMQYNGDIGSASSQELREFTNSLYYNGTFENEDQADEFENYLNSMRTPVERKTSVNKTPSPLYQWGSLNY